KHACNQVNLNKRETFVNKGITSLCKKRRLRERFLRSITKRCAITRDRIKDSHHWYRSQVVLGSNHTVAGKKHCHECQTRNWNERYANHSLYIKYRDRLWSLWQLIAWNKHADPLGGLVVTI